MYDNITREASTIAGIAAVVGFVVRLYRFNHSSRCNDPPSQVTLQRPISSGVLVCYTEPVRPLCLNYARMMHMGSIHFVLSLLSGDRSVHQFFDSSICQLDSGRVVQLSRPVNRSVIQFSVGITVSLSVGRSFCLSVSLSIGLSVNFSVALSFVLSFGRHYGQSFGRSVGLSFVFQSVFRSAFQSICQSVFRSIFRSLCLAICLLVGLSVALSLGLYFGPSFGLLVGLSLSFVRFSAAMSFS